ncbi:MAG: tetratricopeptide repeat protein [Alphaproteobacteria bacterium]|nr:tetratricopeptide repeat protein [Alphaproteobacteria bacterium]
MATEPLLQQALQHHQAGRLDAASALCREIVAAQPNHADGLNLLGVIAIQTGQAGEAVALLRRAVAAHDKSAVHHNNLGQALMALGQLDEAIASFRRALALQPTLAEGFGNLAIAFQRQGNFGDAMALFRRALELKPAFPQAHNNLGNLLATIGRLDAAVEHYDRAIALAPNDPDTHVNRGNALSAQGKVAEAVASFRRAHALRPDDRLLLRCALTLPIVPGSVAEIDAARAALATQIADLHRRGLRLTDPNQQIGQTCFHLAYHAQDDRPLQTAIAALYAAACPALTAVAPHCRSQRTRPDGRLRVGFISEFFRNHTITRLFHGLVAELARERFHVVVLATPSPPDPARAALAQAADDFIELPADLALARQRIADAALDVLIYTDIGMAPLTYFLAFARLAPVQAVLWGHPDTTGIPAIDYFLSCDAMEPPNGEQHYTETLVRLPGPTVHYPRPQFPARLKDRGALGLDAAAHLYVCPQSLFKFHPAFDRVLAAILRRDPAGQLVLVQGAHRHIDDALIGRLCAAAPELGARIVVLPGLNRADFVALLAASDVMLDPLHYSGGNTSLEAFAVGTPIVTWPGEFMRGRHTYGFYRLMGLDDGVARDPDHYVELAVRLGTDPAWRTAVSQRILAANAVLFENGATVRALEDFLAAAVARRNQVSTTPI